MSWGKGKSEKGSGGKRGQSGKDNRMYHQEEKETGRHIRRTESRKQEQAAKSDAKRDD